MMDRAEGGSADSTEQDVFDLPTGTIPEVLTFLFAVSVWEATTVVVAVTAGLYWVTSVPGPPYLAEPYPEDLIGDEEEPRITITDIPFRSGRGRRRRRR